jgi:hypothetical protein
MRINRKSLRSSPIWIRKILIPIILVVLLSHSDAKFSVVWAYDPHFRLPWASGASYVISGSQYNEGLHTGIDYYAIDFGLPNNTEVRAAQGGYATTIPQGTSTYGNYITIDHGNGYSTRYAHLLSFAIANGTYVTQGQLIGRSGDSGVSGQFHLHFAAYFNSQAYMPEPMSGYTGFGNSVNFNSTSYLNSPQPTLTVLKDGFFTDPPHIDVANARWGHDYGTGQVLCCASDGTNFMRMRFTSSEPYAILWQLFPLYSNEFSAFNQPRTLVNPPDTWTMRTLMRSQNCGSNAYGWLGIWSGSEPSSSFFRLTSDWTVQTVTSRFAQTNQNRFRPQVSMYAPNCDYDISQVTFQRNYINNSSWEGNFGYWALAHDAGCNAYYAIFYYTATSPKDGDYSLQANRGTCSQGNVFLYQDVAAYTDGGETYRARVWVRSSYPNAPYIRGIAKLKAYGGTAPEESASNQWQINYPDNQWHEVWVALNLLNSHTTLRVELFLLDSACSPGNGGWCQYDFDGVQVWGGVGG